MEQGESQSLLLRQVVEQLVEHSCQLVMQRVVLGRQGVAGNQRDQIGAVFELAFDGFD